MNLRKKEEDTEPLDNSKSSVSLLVILQFAEKEGETITSSPVTWGFVTP
ncbi:MAG: hypothetical protein NTY64_22140 [Deltaproteobacteria bacterium]|nr:hypothetical protein [Deltaproteobacteria bacterium]